jgi:hypothetical protein
MLNRSGIWIATGRDEVHFILAHFRIVGLSLFDVNEEQEANLPLCLHASSDPINFDIVTTVAQPDGLDDHL